MQLAARTRARGLTMCDALASCARLSCGRQARRHLQAVSGALELPATADRCLLPSYLGPGSAGLASRVQPTL
jgi:hypothetical protein